MSLFISLLLTTAHYIKTEFVNEYGLLKKKQIEIMHEYVYV